MNNLISSNLHAIHQRIREVTKKIGKNPDSVTLVAISKKKSVHNICEAHRVGQIDFGENYVQEFLGKWQELKDKQIQWHFVGHLQRRKVKDTIGKTALIHSLDSLALASEIESQNARHGLCQQCLLQVNLSGEETKSGVSVKETPLLLQEISSLKHIEVIGLMTLPPYFKNPEDVRPYFRKLRELKDNLNDKKVYRQTLTDLSMGMTNDYPVAIEEGATFIRIGTAIFGERE